MPEFLPQINAGIDAYTVLMLHMDGVDTCTHFLDSETTPKAVTAVGNAQIDTAQSKFGNASALFDGAGDYLSVPDSDNWAFGATDWTIDFWFRLAGAPANYDGLFFQGAAGSWDNRHSLILVNTSGTYSFSHELNVGAVSKWAFSYAANPNLSLNTWYHITIIHVTATNTYYCYQNGVLLGSNVDADNVSDLAGAFLIGAALGGSSEYLNGWIDEFRVSAGVARWTSAFTPPTIPYDVNNFYDLGMIGYNRWWKPMFDTGNLGL